MKRSAILGSFFLVLLVAAGCAAADITGTWKGVFQGPEGGMDMTFTFKQEGTKLTGTVQPPNMDAVPFSDGKVEGDKLSFIVTVGDGSMKIHHDGTIVSATEIKLNTKFEGMDQPTPPMTLKKQ
jgi:hypothetical protein